MFDSPFHIVLDFRPTETSRRLNPVLYFVVAASILYPIKQCCHTTFLSRFLRNRHIMVPEVVRDSDIYGDGKQLKTE